MPAAERVRRRPAARASGREDVRSRRARRARSARPLARGAVPHDERRRHPLHQRRRAHELRASSTTSARRAAKASRSTSPERCRRAARAGSSITRYLDATFRENFIGREPEQSRPPSTARSRCEAGDRLPLIPSTCSRPACASPRANDFTLGADLLVERPAQSVPRRRRQPGREARRLRAARTSAPSTRSSERARLFVNVDNVLDEEYETFGVFGEADDVLGDDFDGPVFVGPGAPRAAVLRRAARRSSAPHHCCAGSASGSRSTGPPGRSPVTRARKNDQSSS